MGDRCGGLIQIESEGGNAALSVEGVEAENILASGDRPDLEVACRSRTVVLSWTELNDWATVDAHVDDWGKDQLSVGAEWPPTRRQRREFRRLVMDIPLSVASGVLNPDVHEGRTRDLSGGGLAATMPDLPCIEGDSVAVMLHCDGRDVLAASTVKWVRRKSALFALEFSLIAPADQDYLVGLVAQAEARRGW